MANVLRDYLKGRTPGREFGPERGGRRRRRCLKGDLETVGIPYVVDGPNGPLFADFHSLRHAYVSGLGAVGSARRLRRNLRGTATFG